MRPHVIARAFLRSCCNLILFKVIFSGCFYAALFLGWSTPSRLVGVLKSSVGENSSTDSLAYKAWKWS